MPRTPHRRPGRSASRSEPPLGPFRARDAIATDWTAGAQRHAVRVGDLERVSRGVLAQPALIDPGAPWHQRAEAVNLRRAQASALRCPRAAISHASAAIAGGIPTLGDIARPCLTVQSGTALRNLAGVHLHRATLPEEHVVTIDGYSVTSPARTVLDIAREYGADAGVVAADYVLHQGLADHETLMAAFEVCARWPGRKAARITVAFADENAESPLESLSRLRIAANGLPMPRPQAELCDQYGRFIGRSDFYWDEFGVVGESDGDLKYDGPDSIINERGRHKAFEELGLIVVRWGWSDVFAFDKVARRLRTAYGHRLRRGSPQRRWGVLRPSRRLHP